MKNQNEQISNSFPVFKEVILNIHPELIYNVDEIGFARKYNGKKKKCAIFSTEKMKQKRDDYFNVPNNELTNFTLITAVTLSGKRIKLMLICPVKSCPIDLFTNKI